MDYPCGAQRLASPVAVQFDKSSMLERFKLRRYKRRLCLWLNRKHLCPAGSTKTFPISPRSKNAMRFSASEPKRNGRCSLKCSGFGEIQLRLLRKMNFATSTIAGLLVANRRFGTRNGIAGSLTDRGRILIMRGEPDEMETHAFGGTIQNPGGPPFETWRYRYIEGVGANVILEFVDRAGDGTIAWNLLKNWFPLPFGESGNIGLSISERNASTACGLRGFLL